MARFPMYGMAGIGIAAAIGFVLVLSSISKEVPSPTTPNVAFRTNGTAPTTLSVASTQELSKFSSVDELKAFLADVEGARNASAAAYGAAQGGARMAVSEAGQNAATTTAPQPKAAQAPQVLPAEGGTGAADYSSTNVQVAGVDEPDFVKNDGKYAYVLSGSKLTIAQVYPADLAKIVSKVGLDIQEGQYLQNMFLNNNTLVVFYQEYAQEQVIPQYEIMPQPAYIPKTHILILDVADRAAPRTVKNYVVSGTYNSARMIGDYAYVITTSEIYNYRQPLLPRVAEAGRTVMVPDVYYFRNPEPHYNFDTVTSVNIKSEQDAVNSQTFMMNPAATLYVSQDNIYIAYQKYQPYNYYEAAGRDRFFKAILPLLPQDAQQKIKSIDSDQSLSESARWDKIAAVLEDMYNHMGEGEKTALMDRVKEALANYDSEAQSSALRTVIHRIAIGPSGGLEYKARGEVPGRLLNQFSMDESGNRFRVATTVEYYSQYSSGMYNNVYVLDGAMQTVGSLEKVEKGESIYAARFIGDRLYLVTFQRIDPLFVIDLSSDQPKVLGQLKLPGYSSYLHPYDDTHIIGIGKDTKENDFGGVQAAGVKLSLFDVADVANPRLVGDYVIPGQSTDSEVLSDHKALLFDKQKNVLSIPVSRYDQGPKYGPNGGYVQPKVWRGFYVFGVSPKSGFVLRGTVEHLNGTNYYYYGGVQGSRSFYIGNILYTVSLNNLIKMNDIGTLQELNQLPIGNTGDVIKYPAPLEGGAPAPAQPPGK
jgi:inhibitor of cysteine peptidase